MSLFENPEYQWRETFFVLFDQTKRPSAKRVRSSLESLGGRLQLSNLQADEDGHFESVTIHAPDDSAAMDIVCIVGEEVAEQVPELLKELRRNAISKDEVAQLAELVGCDGRLDIFHFEQHALSLDDEEEPDMLDPGGVLLVLERLGELCEGVAIDPQSSSIL